MRKIYIVGGKWSTVGDKLIYDVQERELCSRGLLLTTNMKHADVVLVGGGGTLYSREGRNDEMYGGNLLDYPLKDMLEARDSHKPLFIAGAGYQGFTGINNEQAWKTLLLSAKSISVRDKMSAEAIHKLIGNRGIDVWPDMAFNLKLMPTSIGSKETIAVTIGQEGLSSERKRAFEQLLAMLSKYYKFLWVPFDASEFRFYQEYWIPAFGGELVSDESFCGHYIPNVSVSIGAFKHCVGVISTRLHALLLAIMINRPILHAGKLKEKVAGQARDLFADIEYPGLVSLQEPTGELVEKVHKLFYKHEYENLFQQIYFKNHALCLNHFKFIEEI